MKVEAGSSIAVEIGSEIGQVDILAVGAVGAFKEPDAVAVGGATAVAGHVEGLAVEDEAVAGGSLAATAAVLGEIGCVGGVAVDGDSAWVLSVAVLPVDEVVAVVGHGGKRCGAASIVGAAAGDGAAIAGVGVGLDGVGCLFTAAAVTGEVGGIGGVLGHGDVEGVVVRTVAPAVEGIAVVGGGGEAYLVAVVVGAAAADGAAFSGVGQDGDVVGFVGVVVDEVFDVVNAACGKAEASNGHKAQRLECSFHCFVRFDKYVIFYVK